MCLLVKSELRRKEVNWIICAIQFCFSFHCAEECFGAVNSAHEKARKAKMNWAQINSGRAESNHSKPVTKNQN